MLGSVVRCIAACFALSAATMAHATVYDEAVNGDLPTTPGRLPIFLEIGTNIITGQFFLLSQERTDYDSFNVRVPSGGALASVTYNYVLDFHDAEQPGLFTRLVGPGVSQQEFIDFLTDISPQDLFADSLPVAGAGVFDILNDAQAFNYAEGFSVDYTWTFVVAPTDIPEPSSALLIGAGLGLFGLLSRRRRPRAGGRFARTVLRVVTVRRLSLEEAQRGPVYWRLPVRQLADRGDGAAVPGRCRRACRRQRRNYFSVMTTAPETGSVTPSPPPRSSSVWRKLSSVAIIWGRAAAITSMLSHSAMMQ
jgi:hypothetical protein